MSPEARPTPAERPVVHVEPGGFDIEVEPGETIMEAAWRLGYYWPTSCYAQAWCTKCAVDVGSGAENFSPVGDEEGAALANRLSGDGPALTRLACRAQPLGDVTVHKEDVFSAHEMDAPARGVVERPEEVLRRAAKRSGGRLLESVAEPDGTYRPLRDLTDPEMLRDLLDRLGQTRYLERLGQSVPLNDPGVVGSNFLKDLTFDLTFVTAGIWSRERRVLDLSLDNVLVDATARPVRIALRKPVVAAIEGDTVEDALLVPDDGALLDLIDEWVVKGTVPQLIAGLRSVARIGERQLWGNIAVGASDVFVNLSHELPGTRAADDQDLFFRRFPELAAHVELVTIPDESGDDITFSIRRNCCLRVKLPDVLICLNCNLLGRDEAVRRSIEHQTTLRRNIRRTLSYRART